MTARVQPTPGWLAQRLLHLGAPGALSLLAAGQLHFDRMEGIARAQEAEQDDIVGSWYENLAYSFDVVGDLRSFWMETGAAHKQYRDALAPLAFAFDGCSDATRQKLSEAAEMLAGVSMGKALAVADGDLLGPVFNELIAQAHRRMQPTHFDPIHSHIAQGVAAVMGGQIGPRTRTLEDKWCGSGSKVVGISIALRMVGVDPGQIRWTLCDPQPLPLALAAVNCLWYDLGPRVYLSVDREHAEKWLAMYHAGRLPVNDLIPIDYVTERARS